MAKISKKNGKMIGQDRKAYLGICQMLFNNELNPGQKIAYKDLAQRLGVSTTPVIHALKLLELKGITRRETNKGYFINTITLQEVEEIFETRIALEVSLLPKTIQNLDQNAVKKLEDALHAHDEAVAENDYSKRVMTDLRFHMTLAILPSIFLGFGFDLYILIGISAISYTQWWVCWFITALILYFSYYNKNLKK